jgi:hypothetical protein
MQQQLPPSTRPRGDITTVLDIASRDSQDGYLFPLDAKNSWFSREPVRYTPSTLNIQDFVHKGAAEWGGRLSFELNSKVLPFSSVSVTGILNRQFKIYLQGDGQLIPALAMYLGRT